MMYRALLICLVIAFAAPAYALQSLTMGPAVVSAGRVVYPVTLSGDPAGQVAGIDADVYFESDAYALITDVHGVVTSVEIGSAAQLAGKRLEQSNPRDGVLQVIMASISGSTIANGVIGMVSFSERPGTAPSAHTFRIVPTATDPAGNKINLLGSSLVLPIPGDCNGDNRVSISEIQNGFNMFLGLKPVMECVDRDRNNAVSVVELQSVIDSFLGRGPR